jgi:CHAT domain-containing protein
MFRHLCVICLFVALHAVHAQETAQSLLKSTETKYHEGNYEASLRTAQKAITFLQTDRSQLDSLPRARLYFYKGASEYYLQRYDLSIASYNKAISLCPSTDVGLNFKAELYYERAFSEYELRNYPASYESSKKAALLMEKVANPNYDYVISIYADIAGTAASLGFMEDAKNHLATAKAIYKQHTKSIVAVPKEVSKPVLLAYKAVEIVNYKTVLTEKDIALATEKVKQLERLKRQKQWNVPEKRMHAVALNMLGDLYLRKDSVTTSDCRLAHQYLNNALRILPQKYIPHWYQFQFNKVKAFSLEKKYSPALQLLQTLLEKLPEHDARRSYFEAEKATLLMALHQKEQALTALRKAIENIHQGKSALKNDYSNFVPSYDLNETGILVEIADTIAQKYPDDKRVLSLAATMYRLGLLQFENCYREERFNDKLTRYYQIAIGGILKLKKLGYGHQELPLKELLNRMEMIENRLSWNKFQQSRLVNSSKISDTLLQQEYTIRKALAVAKRRKDTIAIFQYQKQLAQQIAQVKATFPEIATFAFENFDIQTIQDALPALSVIVKYKKIGDQLFVFKITNSEIDFYELQNSENNVATVQQYYELLRNQKEDKNIAKQLYKQLFPFSVESYTAITILPDHTLHYLPFETLRTNEDVYLIEKATVHYATHLVFIQPQNHPQPIKKEDEIIVFTPNYTSAITDAKEITIRNDNARLLGAESEAKSLAQIFPSKLFEAVLATKDNFIKHSRNAKIIHLAMHATIDNATPELSHLIFNTAGEDTKMYVEELYGLHLNADLAVLSACNTGKGTFKTSSGMVSLSRAFTFAGVPSTLASLWEVPDKITETIMIDFYKNLKKGDRKSVALRNAKLAYLKNTDDANFLAPFYWAGFVLHGDTTPIVLQKQPSTNFICVIGAILTLLIIFIVGFRIRKNNSKFFI